MYAIRSYYGFGQRIGGTDIDLDALGLVLADEHLELVLEIALDRLVELVASNADGFGVGDGREGDDRHLGGAASYNFV